MELMDFDKSKSLVEFGKFLVTHLKSTEDNLDWSYILDQYLEGQIPKAPGLMYINWVVSWYYDQDPVEVRHNKKRIKELAKPRRIVQYLALKKFGYKLKDIQEFYQKKAHATVISNAATVENEMETNKALKNDIIDLIQKIISYGETREVKRDDSSRIFGSIQEGEG
jgi:pyoverdine/dityrosine biosynthesis protein Dit1